MHDVSNDIWIPGPRLGRWSKHDTGQCGFVIINSPTMWSLRVHKHKAIELERSYLGIGPKDNTAHHPAMLWLRHVDTPANFRRRAEQPPKAAMASRSGPCIRGEQHSSGHDDHFTEAPSFSEPPLPPPPPPLLINTVADPIVNPSSSSGTLLPVALQGSFNRGVWRTSGQDDLAKAAPRFSAPPLPPPPPPVDDCIPKPPTVPKMPRMPPLPPPPPMRRLAQPAYPPVCNPKSRYGYLPVPPPAPCSETMHQ